MTGQKVEEISALLFEMLSHSFRSLLFSRYANEALSERPKMQAFVNSAFANHETKPVKGLQNGDRVEGQTLIQLNDQ